VSKPTKSVGVDMGLDLLFHTSSDLKVKHQNFDKDLARIDRLNQILANKKYGSANYKKLSTKIAAIHGRIKRSRQGHQKFYAQQIADVNGAIAVKLVKPLESIEIPLPKKSRDGRYIPNGRTEAAIKNAELQSCALSQAALYLQQQCSKKNRIFTKVEINLEATAQEVLEEANLSPSVIATSKIALKTDKSVSREGNQAIDSIISGKGEIPTTDETTAKSKNKPPVFASIANPPTPAKNSKVKRAEKSRRMD
jgi:hypothetical protein